MWCFSLTFKENVWFRSLWVHLEPWACHAEVAQSPAQFTVLLYGQQLPWELARSRWGCARWRLQQHDAHDDGLARHGNGVVPLPAQESARATRPETGERARWKRGTQRRTSPSTPSRQLRLKLHLTTESNSSWKTMKYVLKNE